MEKNKKIVEKADKKEVSKVADKSVDKNSEKNGDSKSRSSSVKVVKLRNRFFFMLYRYSTLVFLSSIGCLLCSFLFLFIFMRQPVEPQYIAVDEGGRYIKLEPLSQCREDVEVKKFMLSAIKRLYKYDYINYADQIQDAAQYFTTEGWGVYLDEYARSDTLYGVKNYKWIVTVQPSAVPIIIKKDIVNDICTVDAKAEIQVSYIGNAGQTKRGEIHMRIVRNSVINNPDGLGITKVVFVEAETH